MLCTNKKNKKKQKLCIPNSEEQNFVDASTMNSHKMFQVEYTDNNIDKIDFQILNNCF